MKNIQKRILKLGRVEDFEVKNSSIIFFLIGPSLFIYSYFINNYGDENVRIEGAREFFAFLFFIASCLPFIFKKKIKFFFGWIVFLLMLLFSHYVIVLLYINKFSIQFLLGFYVFNFGAVLLFNNRVFINIFLVTIFIHLLQKLMISNIEVMVFNAVVSSFSICFVFSFIILSGSTLFRTRIAKLNKALHKKAKAKTLDLEKKAKDLEEKNLDLEEFAFVVSHDLKTPLRNITALSSWLKESAENNDKVAINTNLELIEKQITQMDLIIQGVLNYSLQNEVSSNDEKINLDLLVKDLIAVNKTDKCLITIKKKLPVIKINKSQILQVFQNLIQNGIKYNDKEICKIEIDYTLENNFYIFSVKDNGIGIEEKYHEKIFKLFQRLDVKTMENVGIGLSLVKKIINRNKGEIYLKSEVNIGTTFYFTLPA
ncbi:His Kinase A (phospho-acceptor) domain-containing protein [Polaribacter sp. KT25b]|uniref:sensor histidine kinase n=1 Tax=Polaribacter sp. KT25b TaxID=1855336 RepID=UPI000879DD18|nr:ATP-binding protein [Polaribacter sp. KT25b]SDR71876.1 His Kinase A (phospho-acceptor) domain-containing protein [Polaribacter sp. KT25b]